MSLWRDLQRPGPAGRLLLKLFSVEGEGEKQQMVLKVQICFQSQLLWAEEERHLFISSVWALTLIGGEGLESTQN